MREATRAAVRSMIKYLGAEHGLGLVDAYMLCSVAADLRLHEVVCPHALTYLFYPEWVFIRWTCPITWYAPILLLLNNSVLVVTHTVTGWNDDADVHLCVRMKPTAVQREEEPPIVRYMQSGR
jgi:hypothetical protein